MKTDLNKVIPSNSDISNQRVAVKLISIMNIREI